MIVFGDHVRSVALPDIISEICDDLGAIAGMPAGIERHCKLCGAFILAGELAQGIADAEMAAAGCDDATAGQARIMRVLMQLARMVIQSWHSGFQPARITVGALEPIGPDLPAALALRQPEGFAHYAVYPESYAQAARALGVARARVIGVRSIGTSLAAIAAAALGAGAPATVRPVGHPFSRTLRLSPSLASSLAADPRIPRVVVDEGPGLSGSSFGAVTSWLADAGVAEPAIACLPSHAGEPGAKATAETRARYGRLRKAVVPFDALCLAPHTPHHRLDTWFADLVGPAVAPLQDISGGAWRGARQLDAPAIPAQEKRKFLLHTEAGTFLLKFAGLGRIGEAKFRRARQLSERGFVPEPLGFRHGFMIERWHADARAPAHAMPLEAVGRYLAARATLFPAQQGADLRALAAMARHNTERALGAAAARALRFNTDLPVRAAHVDARLHRWEWLALPSGRLLKADALDHSTGHDLIGCQDIAWDIAGAAVELDFTRDEAERLRCIVSRLAGISIRPDLVVDYVGYYCAFQLGLWYPSVPARYRREGKDVLF